MGVYTMKLVILLLTSIQGQPFGYGRRGRENTVDLHFHFNGLKDLKNFKDFKSEDEDPRVKPRVKVVGKRRDFPLYEDQKHPAFQSNLQEGSQGPRYDYETQAPELVTENIILKDINLGETETATRQIIVNLPDRFLGEKGEDGGGSSKGILGEDDSINGPTTEGIT